MYLAGKEGERTPAGLEQLQHGRDERLIRLNQQVGLKTDKRALLLRSDVHCEVGVILRRKRRRS